MILYVRILRNRARVTTNIPNRYTKLEADAEAKVQVETESDVEDGEVKTANDGGNITTDETTDGSLDVETDCGKNGEAAAAEVAEHLTANKC